MQVVHRRILEQNDAGRHFDAAMIMSIVVPRPDR